MVDSGQKVAEEWTDRYLNRPNPRKFCNMTFVSFARKWWLKVCITDMNFANYVFFESPSNNKFNLS